MPMRQSIFGDQCPEYLCRGCTSVGRHYATLMQGLHKHWGALRNTRAGYAQALGGITERLCKAAQLLRDSSSVRISPTPTVHALSLNDKMSHFPLLLSFATEHYSHYCYFCKPAYVPEINNV